MTLKRAPRGVSIVIREGALASIFDECDRYDADETGGRLIGVCRRGKGETLEIVVSGVIEPGPNARRTNTSFFQDGDYQADVFRKLEDNHPEIEHLGNWHTHHVNGFPTLSGGDIETYLRIVNHAQHNLDFFYALLVVARGPRTSALDRYAVKHFVLFRDDNHVYEVPQVQVSLSRERVIWPRASASPNETGSRSLDNRIRVKDQEIFGEIFRGFRPQLSKKTGVFFWKGDLALIDGSLVEIMVPETSDDEQAGRYQLIVKNAPPACENAVSALIERRFPSAAQAVRSAEAALNKSLFDHARSGGNKFRWRF